MTKRQADARVRRNLSDLDDAIEIVRERNGRPEHCPEPGQEMEAIARGLDAAKAHGLEVEFVWAFGMHQATGHQVSEAVAHALREWDL